MRYFRKNKGAGSSGSATANGERENFYMVVCKIYCPDVPPKSQNQHLNKCSVISMENLNFKLNIELELRHVGSAVAVRHTLYMIRRSVHVEQGS